MKPNAGTHGDGFYKLEYTDGVFFVNEKESSADRIKELISSQKSSYVITEYIEMHRDLKKYTPRFRKHHKNNGHKQNLL